MTDGPIAGDRCGSASSFRYAGYTTLALEAVDLTLSDGDIVGVVGADRAGKSTLCLVAAGFARGSIGGALSGGGLIDRRRGDGRPAADAFATRVGIGFQNPATQLSA